MATTFRAGRSSNNTGERPCISRGLAVHRSAHHPEQVNAERLREEDRRAAGATKPLPLTKPRNSGWTEDEDRTFIRRYLEFKSTGRAMGYSAFLALELPRKTERQVRDRLVTLWGYRYPYSFIDAPELPAPHPPSPGLASTSESGPSTPGLDIAPEEHDSPGHLDWTTPRMDMTPPGILDETTTPDVTFPQWDMTPLGNPIMAKNPWAMTPRNPLANRLKELAAQEGDIQVQLDELVEELQAAMVATQPAGEPHIRAI
ncbi:hypothetical protein J6590_061363 [Homalodisca vitripennis]|nr:hypothetical protein J6590_061363 [Homalodisca vitripennis]